MTDYESALSSYLQVFLTPARQAKFTEILENRTRLLTIVLVDLFQEHNASAILRSCEAFGIQDIYVVESENTFSTKQQIAMGTERWLTMHRFGGEKGLTRCFRTLKKRGYLTVATVLNSESTPIQNISVSTKQPVALIFGTEDLGLPEEVIQSADICAHIPMYGFVESFNVSIAAALSLQTLTSSLRESKTDWHLSQQECEDLRLEWTRKTIPNCDAIERRFKSEWSTSQTDFDAAGQKAE